MARIPRSLQVGYCFHAINRGNRRAVIFHQPRDYRAFLGILSEAQERIDMPLLAACLMPNHFHFVVRPGAPGELSRWMHWVLTTHVARYRKAHGTEGRIWQGRYKSFPIQNDGHLLAVMRYVERNALRAGLVQRAEYWPWGSLHWRNTGQPGIALSDPPSGLPGDWVRWVNEAQTTAELEAMRKCVNSQRPFGDVHWLANNVSQGDTADPA